MCTGAAHYSARICESQTATLRSIVFRKIPSSSVAVIILKIITFEFF